MPFRVPPVAVEPMLAALIGAIDVDGGPTAEQRRVLAAIAEHVWGRTGFDPDAVVALDPQGAAQALGDPLLRRRFHEVVIALEVCRHPLTATQVERVEGYCAAMGLDGPDLGMLRDLVSRGTERAAADFHRFLDANLAERVEPGLGGVAPADHPEPELAARLAGFADLPAGTLGRAYLDFYERHHLTLPGVVAIDMNHFFVAHDMTHVIAGIATTGPGEVALSAFQMAMDDNPVNTSALL
ncbi:MAG: Coq4 family protein, partial [Actinomycetota bacterium]